MIGQAIGQLFWILNGSKADKGFIHNCITCHRMKVKTGHQVIGMFPRSRVVSSNPFLRC